jgi:hypothetical protein
MTRPPTLIGLLLAAVLASGSGCRQPPPNPQPPAPGSAAAVAAGRPAPGRAPRSPGESTQLAHVSPDPQTPAPSSRPRAAAPARPGAKVADLPLYLPPPEPSRPARQPLWQQRAKNY